MSGHTAKPLHTPYDGSSTPFTIGLRPLDSGAWLEVDDNLHRYLDEKARLLATQRDDVVVAEAGTETAQREVLDLVAADVCGRLPTRYRADASGVVIDGERRADFTTGQPPLLTAASLVQEDLVLMRKGIDGWHLAAAVLCFPSSWTLAEKFGKPLDAIHRPVPGFGPATRTAGVIARIFDNLQADRPVLRYNWSLQAGDALYHPLSGDAREARAAGRPSRFGEGADPTGIFIRVERQTLRRLPRCGDILFTIRIHLDPLAELAAHPQRRQLAMSFAAQLLALGAAELDYKGLAADRDRLVDALRALADMP